MKRINDKALYLYSGLVALVLAAIVAAPSFYSILIVEPGVEMLLSSTENVSADYKEAYMIIRTPHIFGKYEHFDPEGISVKNSMVYFDRMIYTGQDLVPEHRQYLEVVLDRRKKASRLGRYTSLFLLSVTAIASLCYIFEKRRSGEQD
ncbi:MAG TPA: hypothetical protein P5346_05085 [Spirochaetota bacterium]|nr:hypothetical protein [Spirochaetota bacterium]HSA14100.1 hypothetical protein [Spirochaetota bacterium]